MVYCPGYDNHVTIILWMDCLFEKGGKFQTSYIYFFVQFFTICREWENKVTHLNKSKGHLYCLHVCLSMRNKNDNNISQLL